MIIGMRMRQRAIGPVALATLLVMIIGGVAGCAPTGPAPTAPGPTEGPITPGGSTPARSTPTGSTPTERPEPTPDPPVPAGARCGAIGGGFVAIVARGEADCPAVTATMKKFVNDRHKEIGQPKKVGGWSCVVLDGSLPDTVSVYTIAYECEAGKRLIKAWPADSPLPKGSHVAVKDYAGDFVGDGFPYYFSSGGGDFSCAILPPSGKSPGRVGCHGTLPKDAKAPKPVGGGTAAANAVLLTRNKKAAFQVTGDPAYQRTKQGRFVAATKLPPGRVLAFYGVACTTGRDDAVRCVNGKHEFTLRPGAARLT